VGGCNANAVINSSSIESIFKKGKTISSINELKGEKKVLATKPGAIKVTSGDVFEMTFQGAGGYGDPLERTYSLVLRDVVNGRVSAEMARHLYGVIIDPQTLKLDVAATKRERRQLIKDRLNAGKNSKKTEPVNASKAIRLISLGEYLEVIKIGQKKIVRCRCGYQFGPATKNWKENAIRIILPPEAAGRHVKLHEDLEIRQFVCPSCGLSLSVETARHADPPLFDVEPLI
jgi:N-methylhydantoinase B